MNALNLHKPQNTRRQAPVMPVWHQALDTFISADANQGLLGDSR